MNLDLEIERTIELFNMWRVGKSRPSEKTPDSLLERISALSRLGVSHATLSRELRISYLQIERALERFPKAGRATFRFEDKETTITPPSLYDWRTVEHSPAQAQQEACANMKEELTSANRSTPHKPSDQRAPQCAVIQVIDPECVQRIRDQRAVMAGECPSIPVAHQRDVIGEMESLSGVRMRLFAHAPPESLRILVETFLHSESEVRHASGQRC